MINTGSRADRTAQLSNWGGTISEGALGMLGSVLPSTLRQNLYDKRERFRGMLVNKPRLSKLDVKALKTLELQNEPAYETTGVSPGDVAFLHHLIKTRRPSRVIEFGTGKSTWVIARAMKKYCEPPLRLVSLEEVPEWYEAQLRHMPDLGGFVEIIRSNTELWSPAFVASCRFITGRVYVDTPMEQFDFCFIDGPAPGGSCSLDFIKLLERADEPMTALLDALQTTQMAFACLLGADRIQRFSNKLALVENVTRKDLSVAYADMFGSSPKRLPI